MIMYFSGTGNSKYVAERISEQVGGPAPVSLNELIKSGRSEEFESGEPYVFCYPTYAWRMPHILEDYLRKCSFKGDRRAYFLATCGDSVGASSEYAKKLCEKIGLKYMGLQAVVMPENYIAVFNCPSEEKCTEIVEKAKTVIDNAAAMIRDRAVIIDRPGSKILSGIVNSLFYKFIVKAKPFHLEKDCISCGLCAKSCALNNIELTGGKPVWGNNCTHCMACITVCPVSAIEYGKKTQNKRRYRL